MTKLADTFRTPGCRVTRVIVAVDLSDSTNMKERYPESHWLTTYAWFFDLLGETICEYHGSITKYLGDGVMAVFEEEYAAEAINWAIAVQETIADAKSANLVACDCSVGIACGEMVQFETPAGASDYIGSVVDKAFRLCSAANAMGIFAEKETIYTAAMNRVRSRAGSIPPKRKVAEYQGPEESVKVKGFSTPVAYHEILWANARFGVRPEFVTRLSGQPAVPDGPASNPCRNQGPISWHRGRVNRLLDTYGFIRDDSEDFWFNPSSLFRKSQPVDVGQDVWFMPADALPGGKARRAVDVVALGATLSGRLGIVKPNGFGFAQCATDHGDERQIFVHLGDSSPWSPGDEVEFTVGENRQGFAGVDARAPGSHP